MEWLRCEDSPNLFKTPKSVQCCQTGKLKSLIKLVLLKKTLKKFTEYQFQAAAPPSPPSPQRGRGRGEGRRSCTNYTFKTIKMHTFRACNDAVPLEKTRKGRHWRCAARK